MSTTARKARKKAGIPFTKPEKAVTPFFDRDGFKRLSAKKQDEITADRGHELTAAIKDVLDQLRPPSGPRPVRNYTR